MTFEMLVGLNVSDHKTYEAYREGMKPILQKYGGGFRYDFLIEKVLKSEVAHPINRVFAIYFPDHQTKERFFADPDYLTVREQFFLPSVKERVKIAEYERS